MRPLALLVLAFVLAIPVLGCGAENDDGGTRAANPTNPNPAGIGPGNGAAPPPRESIGGRGRGTEPIKGK
jgi:hypothetical protein